MNASLLLHKVSASPSLPRRDRHHRRPRDAEIERVVALDTQALCAIPPSSSSPGASGTTAGRRRRSHPTPSPLDARVPRRVDPRHVAPRRHAVEPDARRRRLRFAFTSFARWAPSPPSSPPPISRPPTRARLAAACQRASAPPRGASAFAEPLMGGGGGAPLSKLSERRGRQCGGSSARRRRRGCDDIAVGSDLTYPADHLPHAARGCCTWVDAAARVRDRVRVRRDRPLVCAGLMISADAEANELIGGKKHEKLLKLRKTHRPLPCFLFSRRRGARRRHLPASSATSTPLTSPAQSRSCCSSSRCWPTSTASCSSCSSASDGVRRARRLAPLAAAGRARWSRCQGRQRDRTTSSTSRARRRGLGSPSRRRACSRGRRRHEIAASGVEFRRRPIARSSANLFGIYSAWAHRSTICRSCAELAEVPLIGRGHRHTVLVICRRLRRRPVSTGESSGAAMIRSVRRRPWCREQSGWKPTSWKTPLLPSSM